MLPSRVVARLAWCSLSLCAATDSRSYSLNIELGSSPASGSVGLVAASPSPPGLIEVIVAGMEGMGAVASGAYANDADTVTPVSPPSPAFL